MGVGAENNDKGGIRGDVTVELCSWWRGKPVVLDKEWDKSVLKVNEEDVLELLSY